MEIKASCWEIDYKSIRSYEMLVSIKDNMNLTSLLGGNITRWCEQRGFRIRSSENL